MLLPAIRCNSAAGECREQQQLIGDSPPDQLSDRKTEQEGGGENRRAENTMSYATNQLIWQKICIDKTRWLSLCLVLFLWLQSMQVKQQSLLKRVDALDKECEELHGQLGKWREKHYDLQHQLRQTSEEKEEVQMQLASQQVCLVALKDNMLHAQCRAVQTQTLSLKRPSVQSFKRKHKEWRPTLLSCGPALLSWRRVNDCWWLSQSSAHWPIHKVGNNVFFQTWPNLAKLSYICKGTIWKSKLSFVRGVNMLLPVNSF